MNISIFKSYDVRGKYPDEINEATVQKIILALREVYKNQKIVVGCDTRLSSPSLYKTVLDSLPSKKTTAAGMITTPMLYFLVNHLDADLGIMITASHNPKEYNGLKIVKQKAVPISGKEILKIIQNHG